MLGVPLLRGGKVAGVFVLGRRNPGLFTDRAVEQARTFADQAVIAIENARLFDQVQAKTRDVEEALNQQTASAEILRVISSSPTDARPVFETIVRTARKLCDAERASVHILRDGAYHAIAVEGPRESVHDQRLVHHPILPGRGSITGRVAEERSVVHIHDVKADLEFTYLREDGFEFRRTMLGVPLLRDGRVIGVIVLQRPVVQPFTKTHIDLVTTFADQAVIAIENARLFDEVQARTRDLTEALRQQTATANVLKVISRSAFNLQAVFDTLIRSAVELVGAAHGTIHIREGDVYQHRASFGFNPELLSFVSRHGFSPGRETLAGRVALSGVVESIPDVLVDSEYLPSMKASINVRSLVGVPLLRDDRVEGMMILARDEPGFFTPRQIELVETFADQALIAIENTRLFEEVQAKTRDLSEALVHQTASGNILKVIASSPTKVAPALQAIVESACEVCDAYDAAVILGEGDHVRFSAHCGPIPIGLETWPLSRRWVGGRSIVDRAPVHVPDLRLAGEEFPDGRDFALRMGHRAILAAPLMREAESVGAIVVRRKEAHPFSDKQIELLRTFADQAVIAIGNVRLFDEVQARTRDLEESLQQQTATADVLKVISRSAFDLPAVLRTLVELAAKLCDADKATITREVNGVYFRAESYGFSEDFMCQIRNIPVTPERGSITGRAMLEGKAIQVEDVEADPAYWPKNFATRGELRTGLGIPMMRNGAPIGVLALMRTKVRPFNAKQIELVQTFADQAVIAIENARLFEEVRARTREVEEALERQTATADILKVIARSPTDVRPVFEAIATSANTLIGGFSATVLRFVGDTIYLAAFTPTNQAADAALMASFPRPLAEFPPFLLVRDGETIQLADTEADHVPPGSRELGRLRGFRSVLFAPLMSKSAAIGIISVTRKEPGAFAAHHVQLLSTFADQAVIAIENVRLFDEVQAKTRDLEEALQQQTATADVLKVISRSAFDLQAVFDTLIASAVELSGSHSGAICVRDGEFFRYRASSGPGVSAEFHNYLVEHPATCGRGSLVGRAVLSRKVEAIPDLREDAEYSVPISSHGNPARALLGVPLLGKEKVEGAIVLTRIEPGSFRAARSKSCKPSPTRRS